MEVAEEGYSKACEVRASAAYLAYVSIARASVTQIEPAYAASARLAELANTAPSAMEVAEGGYKQGLRSSSKRSILGVCEHSQGKEDGQGASQTNFYRD